MDLLSAKITVSMRNLLRQRRRSLFALAAISAGVVAFLLAGGFIQWIFDALRESTIHTQLGHIQITRPGYLREGVADPYRYLLPEATPRVLVDTKEIRTIAPRLAFSGLLGKEEAMVSFSGEGIEPAKEAAMIRSVIVSGRDLQAGDEAALLLGEGLAANIGAAPGDTLVLLASTPGGGVNGVEAKVAGLFATSSKEYDNSVLRAPLALAEKLMRVRGATSWVILLSDTEDTDKVRSRLRASLPATQFEVIPWTDLADFYNKTVTLFSRQLAVVRILIGLIVVLTISNTLMMSVMERTTEIGTSMALGARRSSVLVSILLEGILLGLAGGIAGLLLGLALGWLLSAIGIPMPPPPGQAHGYVGEISLSPALLVDGFFLAFSTTLIASLLPAWKASRMNIVDALRHQR